jgi:hypothetical protein
MAFRRFLVLAALVYAASCQGAAPIRDPDASSGPAVDAGAAAADGRPGAADARPGAAADARPGQPDGASMPGTPDARPGQPGIDAGACSTVPSAVDISKMAATPDYTQTDSAYGGFVTGDNYCGPTSVSNSLMWLADNGFPALAAHTADRKKDQHDLIAKLGSPTYLNTTSLFNGTPPHQVVGGLKKYLGDQGVAYRRLQWQGWTPIAVPAEFDTGVEVPELDWLELAIERNAGVWLLLGFGTHDVAKGEYDITGGHWVTLVGHGWDGTRADPTYLVVHDPWTSGSNADAYVKVTALDPGEFSVLIGGFPNYRHTASGYYRVDGPFEFGAVDMWLLGVVVLELPGPCN